VNWTPFVGSVF